MELSWEKVSAQLQPAPAGHARLVLSKTVPFFCTTLYNCSQRKERPETDVLSAWHVARCDGTWTVTVVTHLGLIFKPSGTAEYCIYAFVHFISYQGKVCIKSSWIDVWFSHIIYCLSDYQRLCKQLPKLIKLQKCYSIRVALCKVSYRLIWPLLPPLWRHRSKIEQICSSLL